MWRCLSVLALLGCVANEDPWVPTPTWVELEPPTSCDGRQIEDGEALELLLFTVADVGEERAIISDQAEYDQLILEYGPVRGLDPNFDTDVLWVHPWVYGGCGPGYEYQAWDWDGQVRLEAFRSADHGCDAYMPQVDILWLRDVDADVGWCD